MFQWLTNVSLEDPTFSMFLNTFCKKTFSLLPTGHLTQDTMAMAIELQI